MENNKKYNAIKISLIAISLFLCVAFFAWTVYPNLQIMAFHKAYKQSTTGGSSSLITDNEFLFEPYTSVQPMLRYLFVALLVKEYGRGNKEIQLNLMPFAISKLEESLPRSSSYLNSYLFLGKAYDVLGLTNMSDKVKSEEYFNSAIKNYEKALEIVPNQEHAISAYSTNLYNRKKIPEAISFIRLAIEKDPRIPEFHYYLGQFLVYENIKNAPEALSELELALEQSSNPNPEITKKTYQKLLFHFADVKDKPRAVIVLNRMGKIDSRQAELYAKIIDYIDMYDQIPEIEMDN